jgi:hypothetical protein
MSRIRNTEANQLPRCEGTSVNASLGTAALERRETVRTTARADVETRYGNGARTNSLTTKRFRAIHFCLEIIHSDSL